MEMTEIDVKKRLSAKDCLDHIWFMTEALVDPEQKIGGTEKVASILTSECKLNNFMNLIKNLLIYKNVGQKDIHFYSEIFHSLDQDHSGTIQQSELLEHLKKADIYENQEELKSACIDIFSRADGNASGQLDFHEFLYSICSIHKYFTKKNLEDVFEHLDWNGDGSISIVELKKEFKGCDVSEIESYMRQIDSDFDGKINR